MPDAKLDREALNAIARYAYGSGFFGEGENGGRGNMGLLKGSDGRLRVIKFNTHRGEGGEVTRDQIKASNFLRDQLLTLARNFGKSEEVIQRIRQELGLAQDDNRPPQSLLTRKVVAMVVKMIDQDIWQNIKRTDDGRGDFNLSTLKSRSGNMEFDSVRNERLGLVTDDAINRSRNTFMSKTVSDAIGVLQSVPSYLAMTPTAMKSFRFVIDETLKLWQESKFSPEVETQLAVPGQSLRDMGSEKKKIKQQLENMVRVNFVRMLIISGKVDEARAYVLKNAKTVGAWDSFKPLQITCGGVNANVLKNDPNLQKWFLMSLNRFRPDPRYSWRLYHPVGEDGTNDICDPLAGYPGTYGRQYGAAFNTCFDEKKVSKGWEVVDPDLQERQELWDEVDKLPKGFLPKHQIDEVRGAISGAHAKFAKEDIRAALNVYKTPIDRQAFVDRLVAAYTKVAPSGGVVPRQKLDALLTRLQVVVFSSWLKGSRQDALTVERCVKWLEDHPAFLRRLDRRLNLDQANLDNLKETIKTKVQSQFNYAVGKGKSFGNTPEVGVYLQSIREYDEGELTIDGKDIPTVPSKNFVMPSGASGTESCIRKAATETLMTKIDNLAQRKLVSFLLSMADGLESVMGDVTGNQKEVKSAGDIMLEFFKDGLSVIGNQNKRFCDMTFEENGSIHLKMTVGCGVQINKFLGVPLHVNVPLTNDSYDIEITIPKPGADFKGGCPDFTVDSIKLSEVDTQM